MRPKIKKVLSMLPEPYASFIAAEPMNLNMHSRRYYDNARISDHHAIVPTDRRPNPSGLNADERQLYDLIVRRLIAAHYPDYECDSARVITAVGEHRFKSTGSTPAVLGWHAVYADDKAQKKEEPPIPPLKVGDERRVEKTTVKQSRTKPPAQHTDASILKLMENAGQEIEDEALREKMKSSGLGTPATRAAIIERLIQVGYARRRGKSIVSTPKGRQLIDVVPVQISSAVTTGKWEKALSEMATNPELAARTAKEERFMSGIRKFAIFLVDAAKQASPSVHFESEAPAKPARERAPRAKKQKF